MATPLSRVAKNAASSAADRAKRIAELKKAVSEIDAAVESMPGGKPPLAPEAQPFDVKPLEETLLLGVQPKGKPLKVPKKKKLADGNPTASPLTAMFFDKKLLKILERAKEEGDLILTEKGWVDALGDSGNPLGEKQLHSKLYELGDAYSTLDHMEADGGGTTSKSLAEKFPLLGDEQGSVDPWADIGIPPKGKPIAMVDDTGQEWDLKPFDVADADPFADVDPNWANTLNPSYEMDHSKILRQQAELASSRQPGENVREYIARLRELQNTEGGAQAVASAVTQLERGLANDLNRGLFGGAYPNPSARQQDYLDYLAANGVDKRTIDAVASGELPMDVDSRNARAQEMGLDPSAGWYRWDHPLKNQFKGYTGAALSQREFGRSKKGALKFIDLAPSKEGLVYTSHDPEFAERGVQIPTNKVTLYPLIGPNDGIVGLDRMPQSAYDAFEAKQTEALRRPSRRSRLPDWMGSVMTPEVQRSVRRNMPMGEHLKGAGDLEDWHNWREHGMRELRGVTPETSTSRRYPTIPEYSTAETRKEYLEPLMASGAKGTLVRDETGLSTAFTPAGAAQLRRADLAPLDPRFKNARNILQSLLVPAVIATGAASQGQK
jgi:hypothetical protein